MINERLLPQPEQTAQAANTFASENFNTVLYTGNGGTQRIGGYINRGAIFNGSSSYIHTPVNSDGVLSISMWIYFVSGVTFHRAIGCNISSGNPQTYFEVGTNGSVAFSVKNNARSASAGTLGSTGWKHIYIDSSGNFYVNGSSVSTSSVSFTGTTNVDLIIGSLKSNYGFFNSKIDQVRYFNKALSSSEVTTLYEETHASTTISTTDIFNDNSGVALYQLDGNANDTGGVSGKFGSAAIFNGSSSRIQLPDNAFTDHTSYTVSAWIKPNSVSTLQNIFSTWGYQDGAVEKGYMIRINSSAKVQVNHWLTSNNSYTSTATISANTFTHILVTATQSELKIYINGSLDSTHSSAGFSFNTSNPVTTPQIGVYRSANGSYAGSFFDGFIDDLRIYSDVLTSTEVGYIYNNTTASIPTDNLVAYYKLDGDARDEQQLYDGTASNVTYAYDGTATNVTYQEATNFQPDLIWVKNRDSSGENHQITDIVSGFGKVLYPNLTNAQAGSDDTYFTEYSNGFSVNTSNSNINGNNYVAWCFNAGEGSAVSNTDGSITSTVKANTEAGFSIVKYTGSDGTKTIGHGLSSAPEMIIIKSTTNASASWRVYHSAIGNTKALELNGTSAEIAFANWNNTSPSASLFTVKGSVADGVWVNNTGNDYIAYCFHSVDGYQKVGSYTGTGAAGNSVVTGFEPAFLMVKNVTDANDWIIVDNKRSTSNPRNEALHANTFNAEYTNDTYYTFDFLSNGFSCNNTTGSTNASGKTYIYLAIAADPDTTTPTVENSFDVVTYTGDGTTTQSVVTDFKPDLIWIKARGLNQSLNVFDSFRGGGLIRTTSTTGNSGSYDAGYLNAPFNDNGFTFRITDPGWNQSGQNYVAWCWKAGDHDDSLPEINTEGTIDSVVSVNDAAGFSIVQWEGDNSQPATIGHGLSAAPELIIHKDLDSTTNWHVYHESVMNAGDAKFLRLNTTNSILTDGLDDVWTSGFSATTFGVGKANNNTGRTQIAYCFTSITGYQKVGSYTGTGATGNVINVGFKPRWIMFKRTDSTGVWFVLDGIRNTSDVWSARIEANKTNAEAGPDAYTVTVSNTGFEMTGSFATYSEANASGGTYIYLAIK
jgi:hypothetical protein